MAQALIPVLISLSASPCSVAPSPTTPVELIVIWGESNAAGGAVNTDPDALGNPGPSAGDLAPHAALQIWDPSLLSGAGAFTSLDIPDNQNVDNNSLSTFHGMELGLALDVEGGELSNPIYVVKAAASGAPIAWYTVGSTWWNKLVLRMNHAISALNAAHRSYRITVMGSIGFNDWRDYATPHDDYVAGMSEFIAQFRALYGQDAVFLLTEFDASHAGLASWVQDVASANARTYSIDVAGTTYGDVELVHWDYRGFKQIAGRMIDKMNDIY